VRIAGRLFISALALCVTAVSVLPDCCLTACHESSAQESSPQMDMSAQMDMSMPMALDHNQSEPSGSKGSLLTAPETACRHCRIAEPAASAASDRGQFLDSAGFGTLETALELPTQALRIIPDLSPPGFPGLSSVSPDLPIPLRI
jgi:hypothetical protein